MNNALLSQKLDLYRKTLFMFFLATGVTTLDEARYFSAMGVQWLGFDISLISPEHIRQIVDWVVGPKFFLEMNSVQEEYLFETANKLHLDGLAIPLRMEIPVWYTGLVFRLTSFPAEEEILKKTFNTHLLIRCADVNENVTASDTLQRIFGNNNCWLEYTPGTDYPSDVYEKLPVKGIIIRCTRIPASDVNLYAEYDMLFERFT